ncbi:MAG: hypothetical protein P4M00_15625 [Azospirillaceae bacterium]|nr:hypothetical protein [Azospirillaceae bacterium]
MIPLDRLRTLWVDTGTAPADTDDAATDADDGLAYFRLRDLEPYLTEIEQEQLGTEEVRFVGGAPFRNPQLLPMLAACIDRDLQVTVSLDDIGTLTRHAGSLLEFGLWHADALTITLSLPHYSQAGYEARRGPGSWQPLLDALTWLACHGFRLSITGDRWQETREVARRGFAALFRALDVPVDVEDPQQFLWAPDRHSRGPVPTCRCGRAVARRWDSGQRVVRACPFLPTGQAVEFGAGLRSAQAPVRLDRPGCAGCFPP